MNKRNLTSAASLFLMAVVIGGGLHYVNSPQYAHKVQAQYVKPKLPVAPFAPFTIQTEESVSSGSQPARVVAIYKTARNRTGDVYTEQNVVAAKNRIVRVHRLDGLSFRAMPELGVRTTLDLPADDLLIERSAELTPESNCTNTYAGRPGAPVVSVLTAEDIQGYRVFHVKSEDANAVREEWLSPEFGCTVVKRIMTWKGRATADQSVLNPVFIQAGDPDPRLFNPDSALQEVKPSDLFRAQFKHQMPHASDDVINNQLKPMLRRDEVYTRFKSQRPVVPAQ